LVRNVQTLLSSFTKREAEALEEYYRHKFSTGRTSMSRSIAFIGDMHVGSRYAVTAPRYKQADDQLKLTDWWYHCVEELGHISRLHINGEPIDGGNVKQKGQGVETDLNIQLENAAELVKMIKADRITLTRGSGYHTQVNGMNLDETFARLIGADKCSGWFDVDTQTYKTDSGQYISQERGTTFTSFFCNIDVNGRLFNITHHLGFNRWFAYRTTALAREMADMEFQRGKYYPMNRNLDFIVRSHVHYFVEVGYTSQHGFTTPAWKFPDQHLFRGGLGGTYPTIGMILIIVEQNGDYSMKRLIAPTDMLPPPEVITTP
jgi:hypothetical protein